jgi:hypothetical protein
LTSSCQGHGGKALAMGGGQWPGPMPPHRARQMPVVGHAVDQGLLARVDVVIGLDQRGAQIQQDQAQAGIADLVKHGVPVGGGHSLRALPRHLGMGVQVIAQLLCHQHEMRVTQVEAVRDVVAFERVHFIAADMAVSQQDHAHDAGGGFGAVATVAAHGKLH